ncbi:MAG: hypothetical protein HY360_11465 [Verrucomicrobia bacterium]|nr:hypothetical protein [Verrucomicrobiota bacterium]
MKMRLVDRLAFWAINRLLSRSCFQQFDRAEYEQFLRQWDGKTAREFYEMSDGGRGMEEALKILGALRPPIRRQLTFPTPAPCAFDVNNHIWIEFHIGRPLDKAPIFFIQHGWRSVSVRGYHTLCRRLNDLGVNAGVLHLPYHFSRRPPGAFNGELAISSNIARSAHAMRQAVQEVCWLKNLLKRMGAPHVGLWGTSYGAWISAMAITMDDGFDGALLLEPPVEIEELFWEMPLFSNLQKELQRLGVAREKVCGLFKLVTPYHHSLRIQPDRVLILGSEHDPIGHPASLKRLHVAWPGSYLEIFPFGHISYRLHRSAMDRFLSVLAPRLL